MKFYIKISLFLNIALIGLLLYFVFNKDRNWFLSKDKIGITNIRYEEETRLIDSELSNSLSLKDKVEILSTNLSPSSRAKRKVDTYLAIDPYLEIVNCRSQIFKQSNLRTILEKLPKLKIYLILSFNHQIGFRTIEMIKRRYGFVIANKNYYNEFLKHNELVFYGRYRNLKYLINNKKVKKIYLLTQYTAKGFYRLDINSPKSIDDILLSFHQPFTKMGRELLTREPLFLATRYQILNNTNNLDIFMVNTDIKKNQMVTYYTEIEFKIQLQQFLRKTIYSIGDLSLQDYRQKMLDDYPNLYNTYTNFSEKIHISPLVENVVKKIDSNESIKDIWAYIEPILYEAIEYDTQKRRLFFSGNLPYDNIKDMYLTVTELSEKKVGACPEQSSLEVAVLRAVGIAARTATRLYHIYTEIFIPEIGWVTTSPTLNEISLCHSADEKQSYFVNWIPSHPIYLKWSGVLYPAIAY